jgi:hypothetical protein
MDIVDVDITTGQKVGKYMNNPVSLNLYDLQFCRIFHPLIKLLKNARRAFLPKT